MKYHLALLTFPLLWFINNILTLVRNHDRVKHIDVPKIFCPVSPSTVSTQLLIPHFVPLLRRFPRSWHRYVYFLYAGSTFDDRYRVHELLGAGEGGRGTGLGRVAGLYVLVTAGYNDVYVADATAAEAITGRSREFQKPTAMYKPLEVFGPNVDTVEGETWKLHRKATTGSFNERNFSSVWSEALHQAQDMLQMWLSDPQNGTKTTSRDTKVVALNVMAGSLFSRRSSFLSGVQPLSSTTSRMDFREAMAMILENLIFVFTVPTSILSLPFMPKKFGLMKTAYESFKAQVANILEEEHAVVSKREPGSGNLITSLIRSSQESNRGHSRTLNSKEVLGNVFIYSFAGHETTASALEYSIHLLAANPEYQDWLREEIVAVIGDQDNIDQWEYQALFPRLKRCLAVMLETLRLYGPVTGIPKYTNASTLSLRVGDQTHKLPPETVVTINTSALHTLPQYWGYDSLEWRPTRWIEQPSPSNFQDLDAETMLEPVTGSYLPWSAGPRVCPGKKFSQVEFVAVLATLLRRSKVRPVLKGAETFADARKRIFDTVEDSRVTITLQIRHPEKVPLIWSEA